MHTSRDLPPGYNLRAPNVDEAPVIDGLAVACDAAFGSPPTLSEDMIRDFWMRPGFVLETDAWVIEREESLVGYAQVLATHPTRVHGFGIVHPAHMGRSLGSALATLIEHRASQKAGGDARLFSSVLTQDEAAARMLAARGYEWARRFSQMEVEVDAGFQGATPPPGILLRRLDPKSDLPEAHRILQEAFNDHWDHTPSSYEEFVANEVNAKGFDPSLWVIATDSGKTVGVLYGEAHSDRGWVVELGVQRTHRGRGIATALLRESLAEFGRRGLPRVRLNVDSDNPTGAVSLYERVGMQVVTSYDLWGLDIQPPPGR